MRRKLIAATAIVVAGVAAPFVASAADLVLAPPDQQPVLTSRIVCDKVGNCVVIP